MPALAAARTCDSVRDAYGVSLAASHRARYLAAAFPARPSLARAAWASSSVIFPEVYRVRMRVTRAVRNDCSHRWSSMARMSWASPWSYPRSSSDCWAWGAYMSPSRYAARRSALTRSFSTASLPAVASSRVAWAVSGGTPDLASSSMPRWTDHAPAATMGRTDRGGTMYVRSARNTGSHLFRHGPSRNA